MADETPDDVAQSAAEPHSMAAQEHGSQDRPTGNVSPAEAPEQEAPPVESPAEPDVDKEQLPNIRPTASASVAAETAPAQDTAGPSTDVDSVPAADPQAPVYRHGMFGVQGSGDTSGFGGLVRRVPVAPTAEKPYGGYFDEIDASLTEAWPGHADHLERVVIHRGEMTMHVDRDGLLQLLQTLRDDVNLRFELLSAVSGVHYPDDITGRPLHSVYHLTSLTYRRRLRVEVAVPDDDPHVPSATGIYPTADWQERETWDLMGIVYDGHPGLTRILMPDDWEGHPQRKDYPLGGIAVEYKGASIPPPDERRSYA
jgi:NADH-quinone oxidoreductase subunit C